MHAGRSAVAAALVVLVPSINLAGESEARTSEELTDKHVAWAESGLRLHLSIGYQLNTATDPAPAATSVVPGLHVGWRLNERFSLFGAVQYSAMVGGELDGVRASVTVEPVWHATEGLSVALGLGYGAMLGSRQRYVQPTSYGALEAAAQPGRNIELQPFNDCDGDGIVVLARATYLFRVGHLFSTGPMLHLDSQWTSCIDADYTVTDPAGASFPPKKVFRQWWWHRTVGLAWVFAWR
ncbi:hypothetical protein ACFL6C_06610 [Myxococcota bacterium]